MPIPKFDIFSGSSEEGAVWVEAANDLPTAIQRMEEIAAKRPGAYFVFFGERQSVVARVNTFAAPSKQKSTGHAA